MTHVTQYLGHDVDVRGGGLCTKAINTVNSSLFLFILFFLMMGIPVLLNFISSDTE